MGVTVGVGVSVELVVTGVVTGAFSCGVTDVGVTSTIGATGVGVTFGVGVGVWFVGISVGAGAPVRSAVTTRRDMIDEARLGLNVGSASGVVMGTGVVCRAPKRTAP